MSTGKLFFDLAHSLFIDSCPISSNQSEECLNGIDTQTAGAGTVYTRGTSIPKVDLSCPSEKKLDLVDLVMFYVLIMLMVHAC